MSAVEKKSQKEVEKARQALIDLPSKSPTSYSMRALVETMAPQIIEARRKGYSVPEIVEVLAQQGIDVKESSIRTYLSRSKKKKEEAGQQ